MTRQQWSPTGDDDPAWTFRHTLTVSKLTGITALSPTRFQGFRFSFHSVASIITNEVIATSDASNDNFRFCENN